MEKIVLKNVTIIDKESSHHLKKRDIAIENGTIKTIKNTIDDTSNYKVINLTNLHISKGWIDTSVAFGEPGLEENETLANGINVAAKSGFTDILLQPFTQPIIDQKSSVEFLKNKTQNQPINAHIVGALTQQSKGEYLAELYDMHLAGAIAFSDFKQAIQNSNLQKIALQYAQNFNGLIISFCQDNWLKGKGMVNEGIEATKLGLKSFSSISEEIHVARNLQLLEYTGGKLHLPTLSSSKSVKMVSEAKKKGLQVTCSVSVNNLVLNDAELISFNTNTKLNPPLGNEENRKELIKLVLNNTVDCITSDHLPINTEHKNVEYDYAQYGSIGLESVFGALCKVLPLEIVIEKITSAKNIFNIKHQPIEENSMACLSLFIPDEKYIFKDSNILSSSKNAIFLNKELIGKAIGTICNNKITLNV